MFNGIDRFSERQGAYFRFVQPFTTLQRTPSAGVYMYSFGLDDTTNKNTGTMNFSRVDTATLLLTTKAATASSISTITNTDTTVTAALTAFSGAKVFGVNYNVLRVMSGMAGLAYAN